MRKAQAVNRWIDSASRFVARAEPPRHPVFVNRPVTRAEEHVSLVLAPPIDIDAWRKYGRRWRGPSSTGVRL